MRWLLVLIVAGLFGGAYYLLTLNFSNGPIEIGRGLLGITLPFAPFIAAIGLLLYPARMIVPGGQLVVPSLLVLTLIAFIGHRYLRGTRESAA